MVPSPGFRERGQHGRDRSTSPRQWRDSRRPVRQMHGNELTSSAAGQRGQSSTLLSLCQHAHARTPRVRFSWKRERVHGRERERLEGSVVRERVHARLQARTRPDCCRFFVFVVVTHDDAYVFVQYHDTCNEGQRYTRRAFLDDDEGSRTDGSERRHARTRPADVLSRYSLSLPSALFFRPPLSSSFCARPRSHPSLTGSRKR